MPRSTSGSGATTSTIALDMISLQLMQAGPVYVFRNVFDRAADIKDGNPGSYNVGVPGSTYGSASPMKLSQNNGGSDQLHSSDLSISTTTLSCARTTTDSLLPTTLAAMSPTNSHTITSTSIQSTTSS